MFSLNHARNVSISAGNAVNILIVDVICWFSYFQLSQDDIISYDTLSLAIITLSPFHSAPHHHIRQKVWYYIWGRGLSLVVVMDMISPDFTELSTHWYKHYADIRDTPMTVSCLLLWSWGEQRARRWWRMCWLLAVDIWTASCASCPVSCHSICSQCWHVGWPLDRNIYTNNNDENTVTYGI